MDRFWTVLIEGTKDGYQEQYDTLSEAEKEAARLAAGVGKRAFVLELVASCIPAVPVWEEITYPQGK